MTLAPLVWSDPFGEVSTGHEATEGATTWSTFAMPSDVTRIHYVGQDADGTFVNSIMAPAHAETVDEARILIDVLRAGTDHLPDWREQLESAGFVRSHPDRPEGDVLHGLWKDVRKSGHFDVNVIEGVQSGEPAGMVGVRATYQATGSNSWHNVLWINGSPPRKRTFDANDGTSLSSRSGLPEGIDALKAGVAAVIAIRAARIARGGRFSEPLGGPTRARNQKAKAKIARV